MCVAEQLGEHRGMAARRHGGMSALSADLDTRTRLRTPNKLPQIFSMQSALGGSTLPRTYKHLSIMHFLSSPYIKNYQADKNKSCRWICHVQWTLKIFSLYELRFIFMRCNFVIDKCAHLTVLWMFSQELLLGISVQSLHNFIYERIINFIFMRTDKDKLYV